MGKKTLIILVALFVAATIVYADLPRGRDIVETGEIISLDGTLVSSQPEWYVDTEEGRYQLHLGNKDYLSSTGADLTEGASVTVEGWVNERNIAVYRMTLGESTYAFRSEDGIPLWSGRGERTAWNQNRMRYGDGAEFNECERNRRDSRGFEKNRSPRNNADPQYRRQRNFQEEL
jgi:hypothetical protein